MSDANSPEHGATTGTGGASDGTPSPTTAAETTAAERRSEPGSVHVLLDPDLTRVVLAGDVDATLAPDLIDASTDVAEAGLPGADRHPQRDLHGLHRRVVPGPGGRRQRRPARCWSTRRTTSSSCSTSRAIGDLVDVERSDGSSTTRTGSAAGDDDDAA